MTVRLTHAVASGCAAVLAGFTTNARSAPPLDFPQARTPAEQLAICDATAFLASRPDLNANRILVRRHNGAFYDYLLPPDFLVGGQFYTETADRVFFRLRGRGEADRNAVADAQERLVRPIIRAQGRAGHVPYRAWRVQLQECNAFAQSQGIRGAF